jgi:hypothetical protein
MHPGLARAKSFKAVAHSFKGLNVEGDGNARPEHKPKLKKLHLIVTLDRKIYDIPYSLHFEIRRFTRHFAILNVVYGLEVDLVKFFFGKGIARM